MRPFIVVVTLVVLACAEDNQSVFHSGRPAPSSEPNTVDAIRELVLRDLISHDSDQARVAGTSACFISFEKNPDPPQAFLDRLTGACALVRPWSQLAAAGGPVRSSPTGGTRISFNVGSIHWRTNSEADLEAGYNCGSLCSAAYQYRVRWTASGWVVDEATMMGIS